MESHRISTLFSESGKKKINYHGFMISSRYNIISRSSKRLVLIISTCGATNSKRKLKLSDSCHSLFFSF